MKDKVTIDGVELTREQIEAALAKLNEPDTPKFGRWKPEAGETYYLVDADGDVIQVVASTIGVDPKRYALGNVYRTAEEAQNAADRQRAEVRLKDWAAANGAFVAEVGDERWVVEMDTDDVLGVDFYRYTRHPDEITFRTEKDAERFLEACRDDLNIFWGID